MHSDPARIFEPPAGSVDGGSRDPSSAPRTPRPDGDAPEASAWWDFTTGGTERDRHNLRMLLESVQELSVALDPRERMGHAVDRVLALTGAERGILLQERSGALVPFVARDRNGRDLPSNVPHCRSVVRQVSLWRTLYRVVATSDDGTNELGISSALDLHLLSIMVAPLEYDRRFLGVLYLDASYRTRPEFTEDEERVFRTMTGLISACLEQIRLQGVQAEQERIQRQLAFARDVQERLLPQHIPAIPGFEFARETRAGGMLSGDYHDVVLRGDGRVVLAVGDVCGSGIGQAMYAAMVRAQLRLLVRQGAALPDILAQLNRLLLETMPGCSNMTLFLAEIDPAHRRFTHANAGHNPPLHATPGAAAEELTSTGPLLGFTEEARWDLSAPRRIAPGDAFLLYTDGLTECRDARGALYGEERLAAALSRLASERRSAADLLAGVLADADAFGCPGLPSDDLTLLVVRVQEDGGLGA